MDVVFTREIAVLYEPTIRSMKVHEQCAQDLKSVFLERIHFAFPNIPTNCSNK